MKKTTRIAAALMVVAALTLVPSMAMAAPAASQARIGGGFSFLNSILGLFGFGSVDGAIWGGKGPGGPTPDGAIWGGRGPGGSTPEGAIWGGKGPGSSNPDGAIWGGKGTTISTEGAIWG